MLYTDVVSSALAFADRADNAEVVAMVPQMLRLVESRVNRKLRSRKQVARAQIATSEGKEFYGLPADFGDIIDITFVASTVPVVPGGRGNIPVVNMEYLDNIGNLGTKQLGYAVVGNQLQIWPTAAAGWYINLVYHRIVPPLTPVDCPENWLSQRYPDAYIQGLLVEISAFVKDADSAQLWDTRFVNTIDEIQTESNLDEWSGQPIVMRLG